MALDEDDETLDRIYLQLRRQVFQGNRGACRTNSGAACVRRGPAVAASALTANHCPASNGLRPDSRRRGALGGSRIEPPRARETHSPD